MKNSKRKIILPLSIAAGIQNLMHHYSISELTFTATPEGGIYVSPLFVDGYPGGHYLDVVNDIEGIDVVFGKLPSSHGN